MAVVYVVVCRSLFLFVVEMSSYDYNRRISYLQFENQVYVDSYAHISVRGDLDISAPTTSARICDFGPFCKTHFGRSS